MLKTAGYPVVTEFQLRATLSIQVSNTFKASCRFCNVNLPGAGLRGRGSLLVSSVRRWLNLVTRGSWIHLLSLRFASLDSCPRSSRTPKANNPFNNKIRFKSLQIITRSQIAMQRSLSMLLRHVLTPCANLFVFVYITWKTDKPMKKEVKVTIHFAATNCRSITQSAMMSEKSVLLPVL